MWQAATTVPDSSRDGAISSCSRRVAGSSVRPEYGILDQAHPNSRTFRPDEAFAARSGYGSMESCAEPGRPRRRPRRSRRSHRGGGLVGGPSRQVELRGINLGRFPADLAAVTQSARRDPRYHQGGSDRRLRLPRRGDAGARPPGPRRRAVRAGDDHGAADPAGARQSLHRRSSRRSTACATTAVSSRRRTETLAEVLRAHGYAHRRRSSPLTCSTPSGASTRGSRPSSTISTSRSQRRSRWACPRPGNEVVDRALPWLEGIAGERVLRLGAPLRPPHPLRAAGTLRARYPGRPYNGEIAFADAQVGRLVDFLDGAACSTGRSSSSSAITARAWAIMAKGRTASSSTSRRPRAVHRPGAVRRACADARVADPVRTVDVMPTVLDLLGVPHAAPACPGTSLVAADDRRRARWGSTATPRRCIRCTTSAGATCGRSATGRFKLIAAPPPELYDLELDPGETTNLFDSGARSATGCIGSLRALEARFREPRRPIPPRRPMSIPRCGRGWPRSATSVSFVATGERRAGARRSEGQDRTCSI